MIYGPIFFLIKLLDASSMGTIVKRGITSVGKVYKVGFTI